MAEKYPYLAHTNENAAPIGRQGFSSGGGSGMSNDMEARVKALESRTDRIEGKLDTIIEKVAGMEGEMRRLPGYPGLIVLCGLLVGVVTLIVRLLPPTVSP